MDIRDIVTLDRELFIETVGREGVVLKDSTRLHARYTYILKVVGAPLYKIGRTKNLWERIISLKNNSHANLYRDYEFLPLAFSPIDYEKRLHRALNEQDRSTDVRELFYLSEDDVSFIIEALRFEKIEKEVPCFIDEIRERKYDYHQGVKEGIRYEVLEWKQIL